MSTDPAFRSTSVLTVISPILWLAVSAGHFLLWFSIVTQICSCLFAIAIIIGTFGSAYFRRLEKILSNALRMSSICRRQKHSEYSNVPCSSDRRICGGLPGDHRRPQPPDAEIHTGRIRSPGTAFENA